VIGSVINSHASFAAGISIGYRVLAGILAVLGVLVVAIWPRALRY
jgi:hypothetical protein